MYCVITADIALHCIIKCRSPNNVKVTKLQRKGLAWQVGCMGVFGNYILCQSEKWMEEKIVHRLLFTVEWKTLFGRPRHRWKVLTLSYIRCGVGDGIGLAQVSCNLNEYSFCMSGRANMQPSVTWIVKVKHFNKQCNRSA